MYRSLLTIDIDLLIAISINSDECFLFSSCPECRVPSHFVIPSVIWVEEEDEKKLLLELYMENTKKKVCKYFKVRGRGMDFGL